MVITVVAALIQDGDKYLIAKRSTGDPNVYGKWEFPGGKVEQYETEKQAIEREIKEEFELEIIAEEYITHNVCEYPKKTVDLKLYRCKYIGGNFHLHDHSEYKWISVDEMITYDLAPADIPLAKFLKEMM